MQRNSDSDNRNRRDDGRLPFMPPKGWSAHYVIVFSALMLLYGIVLLVTLPEDYIVSEDASGLRNLVNDLSSAMPFVAFLSYLATEAMRAMVFFSEKVKESRDRAREAIKAEGRAEGEARGRAEGEARGRAEGEAQGVTRGKAERDAAWREWFDEFEKARRENRPFDTPPPDAEDADED